MATSTFKSSMIFRILIRYGLYHLAHCFIHLIFVSIIMFFHFLLNHGLAVIEVWLAQSAWRILILSKLTATGLFFLVAHKFSFWQLGSMPSVLSPDVKFALHLEVLTIIPFLLLAFLAPQWHQEIAWR